MTTYYLDTSALSKRYVQETGTAWISALADTAANHTFLTARVTMVEVYSALARRKREGSVPVADCEVAERAFTAHSATEYEFVELDLAVVNLTRDLLGRHPLRAYDAVQLSSAIIVNQALQAAHLAPLIFLSADGRLNTAAAAEGLAVDDPNLHP
jgi:predicted nucleic acid-binding protein